jgi:hypothetical protein
LACKYRWPPSKRRLGLNHKYSLESMTVDMLDEIIKETKRIKKSVSNWNFFYVFWWRLTKLSYSF